MGLREQSEGALWLCQRPRIERVAFLICLLTSQPSPLRARSSGSRADGSPIRPSASIADTRTTWLGSWSALIKPGTDSLSPIRPSEDAAYARTWSLSSLSRVRTSAPVASIEPMRPSATVAARRGLTNLSDSKQRSAGTASSACNCPRARAAASRCSGSLRCFTSAPTSPAFFASWIASSRSPDSFTLKVHPRQVVSPKRAYVGEAGIRLGQRSGMTPETYEPGG